MSHYTDTTWGDLGELFDGPHATPTRTDNGPHFLNISSLINGRLDLNQSDHVSNEDFAKWTRRVTPAEGDLLFSYETRLGEAALMPADVTACLGRRMALLRPDRNVVDPRFLLYFYLSPSFQQLIDQHTIHGATVNRISLSTMGSWRLSIPDLSIQRAIAEVLGALDDKIAANTKLARATDEYLSALFVSMASTATHTTALGEIADINAITIKPHQDGQLRYIDIASVKGGWHETPELSDWADAPSRARRGVQKGDTLWSTVRPNRRSHSLNLANDPLLVGSTGLAVLSPRNVGFAYLYEVCRQAEFSSQLENVAEGSAYPAVRADRFHTVTVPMLPADQRHNFERIAASLREQAHSLTLENDTIAAMRDALLPYLISGKLHVKDAEKFISSAV